VGVAMLIVLICAWRSPPERAHWGCGLLIA
jgi:hypothetical protein